MVTLSASPVAGSSFQSVWKAFTAAAVRLP